MKKIKKEFCEKKKTGNGQSEDDKGLNSFALLF